MSLPSLIEQAQDPTTPQGVLEELAKRRECRPVVSSNPNAPFELLLRLARAYPHEVAENTGFHLALMLDPERLDRLEEEYTVLAALARVADAPEAILKLATRSSDTSVRAALLTNPRAPEALLKDIVLGRELKLAEVAIFHRNLTGPPSDNWRNFWQKRETLSLEEVRGELLRMGPFHASDLALISTGVIEGNLLSELAAQKKSSVRAAVAHSRKAWPELLARLAEDDRDEVRLEVASNVNTPAEALRSLAADPVAAQAVAGNPNTDVEALWLLAETRPTVVRELVAHHQNCDVELLEYLAGDIDPIVRGAVAGNALTPKRLLRELAEQGTPEVLDMLVINPNAPRAALRAAAELASPESLFDLLSRHDLTEDMVEIIARRIYHREFEPEVEILEMLARQPAAPAEILWWLSEQERNLGLGESIVANPNAPEDLLVHLATNGNFGTRFALSLQPHLPASVVQVLREDIDPQIRDNVELQVPRPQPVTNRNPYRGTDLANAGVHSASDLRSSTTGKQQPDGVLSVLKQTAERTSFTPLGAFLLITHPRFKELDRWRQMELNVDWFVRFSLTLNPDTPREVLERLTGDADVRVAAGAAEALKRVNAN